MLKAKTNVSSENDGPLHQQGLSMKERTEANTWANKLSSKGARNTDSILGTDDLGGLCPWSGETVVTNYVVKASIAGSLSKTVCLCSLCPMSGRETHQPK